MRRTWRTLEAMYFATPGVSSSSRRLSPWSLSVRLVLTFVSCGRCRSIAHAPASCVRVIHVHAERPERDQRTELRTLIGTLWATRVRDVSASIRSETFGAFASARNLYASLTITAQLRFDPFPSTRSPATTTRPTDNANTIATV